MRWGRKCLSTSLILKLILLHHPWWLVGQTTVDVPATGAPIVIATSGHPIAQGWMPPLVRHPRRPYESLLYAGACLGMLLCRDASFYLLIRIGPCLFHTRWPLSCRGSSLLRRGSWIAERVLWLRGRKDWRPFHACLGRCTWNMMLAMSVLMPLNEISSSRRAHPVLGPNSVPKSAGH
jgi:hypothetical protein